MLFRSYSDLYERGMLDEPGALDRAMSRVGNESVRLHRLVNAMMELVRGGEGRVSLASEVDVLQVVQAVVDDLRAAYPERQIDSRVETESSVSLAGDPARIHQAVLNLGANACTHTPTSTPIMIAVETPPGGVAISVIDHGAGIDEAERERIFLPFYQADRSRARRGQGGAGLGLAVTQIGRAHV